MNDTENKVSNKYKHPIRIQTTEAGFPQRIGSRWVCFYSHHHERLADAIACNRNAALEDNHG